MLHIYEMIIYRSTKVSLGISEMSITLSRIFPEKYTITNDMTIQFLSEYECYPVQAGTDSSVILLPLFQGVVVGWLFNIPATC